MGFILGCDLVLCDEVIVVGVYYDYLGELGDKVYLGVDDNVSVVVILLEWLCV